MPKQSKTSVTDLQREKKIRAALDVLDRNVTKVGPNFNIEDAIKKAKVIEMSDKPKRRQLGILVNEDLIKKGKVRALELDTSFSKIVEAGIIQMVNMPENEARKILEQQ